MEKLTKIGAIKKYFEQADSIALDGGRKITMAEAKELTGADRTELAELCAAELGVELKAVV